MALKSYSSIKKRRKMIKRRKHKPLKDIANAGVTAIIGTALISETANVIKKI